MAAQRSNPARSGRTRRLHDLAEPNFHGGTRVHRRFFNGLLGGNIRFGVNSNGAYSNTANSAYQYQLLKRDLLRQEIANPGESMSGPVVFRDPVAGATPTQVQQIQRQIDLFNLSIDEGYMSPTGRVSTAGTLQRESKSAAREERVMAAAEGRPYVGVVGHGPDTTWTGKPVAPFWQDMDFSINSSLGRQAQNYPLGYRPTRAIYEGDLK